MYKDGYKSELISKDPDLFNQVEIKPDKVPEIVEKPKDFELKHAVNYHQISENKHVEQVKMIDKKKLPG